MDELLDIYAQELDIFSASYEMMGQMLNKEHLKARLEILKLSDLYIYGGGYLGIQLYIAINPFVNILNIVDKSGELIANITDIPVISLDRFKAVYRQEQVIITPIKHYKSIYTELTEFVPEDKLIYLGELIGGKF